MNSDTCMTNDELDPKIAHENRMHYEIREVIWRHYIFMKHMREKGIGLYTRPVAEVGPTEVLEYMSISSVLFNDVVLRLWKLTDTNPASLSFYNLHRYCTDAMVIRLKDREFRRKLKEFGKLTKKLQGWRHEVIAHSSLEIRLESFFRLNLIPEALRLLIDQWDFLSGKTEAYKIGNVDLREFAFRTIQ